MTTLAARLRSVNNTAARVYEVRLVAAGTRAFARYDRVTDRVTVLMPDGTSFTVAGTDAARSIRCLHDRDGRRAGDPSGDGARAFRAYDRKQNAIARADARPVGPPPRGCVADPLAWAAGILDSSCPQPAEWRRFAHLILASGDPYYRRPGAWVRLPALVGPASARTDPDDDAPAWASRECPGAGPGHDDGPR